MTYGRWALSHFTIKQNHNKRPKFEEKNISVIVQSTLYVRFPYHNQNNLSLWGGCQILFIGSFPPRGTRLPTPFGGIHLANLGGYPTHFPFFSTLPSHRGKKAAAGVLAWPGRPGDSTGAFGVGRGGGRSLPTRSFP